MIVVVGLRSRQGEHNHLPVADDIFQREILCGRDTIRLHLAPRRDDPVVLSLVTRQQKTDNPKDK